jgi:hypothetical protein
MCYKPATAAVALLLLRRAFNWIQLEKQNAKYIISTGRLPSWVAAAASTTI